MTLKTKKIIVGVIVAIIIVGAIGYFGNLRRTKSASPQALTVFAQCLKDKGAVFYGAFWCTHCQAQKAAFGDAQKNLPYVECSTPDGQGQTQNCQAKQIQGYPTWVFSDGSRQEGELSFEVLSQKTGCALPQ